MTASYLIRSARRSGGISKRRLAALAGTSPAAVVEYESGRRDPGVETLDRLLHAAGCSSPRLDPSLRTIDRRRNGERLAAVLALAEHLPHKPATRALRSPQLPTRQ